MDAHIRIWSLAAVMDGAAELDPSQHKLLAVINDHTSCINVVRFSRDGRQLASGSDDRVAMIHELRAGKAQAAFGSSETSVENWKCVQVLRGHEMNVVDAAWSMDDRFLATASLDRHVGVFDVKSGGRPSLTSRPEQRPQTQPQESRRAAAGCMCCRRAAERGAAGVLGQAAASSRSRGAQGGRALGLPGCMQACASPRWRTTDSARAWPGTRWAAIWQARGRTVSGTGAGQAPCWRGGSSSWGRGGTA